MNVWDYVEAEMVVFPLWGVNADGGCECGNPECNAILKHPRPMGWQSTPKWSDEQLEAMELYGQFDTGFGVLCDGYLVVDVDPRNGGNEALEKLLGVEGLADLVKDSGFVVNTGGGGLHVYYKIHNGNDKALKGHLGDYKGIDFKSSGFVVGCGSLHASGAEYETRQGHPEKITEAPKALIELLIQPERYRAKLEGSHIDISGDEIGAMLSHIDSDMEYLEWVKVGMAIHDATGGSQEGFMLWDSWSASGSKYSGPDDLDHRWQGFGKNGGSSVTIGTIIKHARDNGYKAWNEIDVPDGFLSMNDSIIETVKASTNWSWAGGDTDLRKPPGVVGDVAAWIRSQCLYPRDNLAVIAALTTIGNIGGMYWTDQFGATTNLMSIASAGSGTGKDSVLKAVTKLHSEVGLAACTVGAIKSEQEIIRNLIRHQPAFYLLDELGYLLQKIEKARTKGGASYLDGVIAMIMNVFTKADSTLVLGGDVREEVEQRIKTEIGQLEKSLGESESQYKRNKLDGLMSLLEHIENGLPRPFLSIMGFTTPETFDQVVSGEQAKNGFIARSIIVNEPETNPRRKKGFIKPGVDQKIISTLIGIMAQVVGTECQLGQGRRVQYMDNMRIIEDTPESLAALDDVYEHYHDMGETNKETNGLEAITRRGFELVLKVSLILAIADGGTRTVEHIRWATAFIDRDMLTKIRMASANMAKEEGDDSSGLAILILDKCENWQKEGVIVNQLRKSANKSDVLKMINELVVKNKLEVKEGTRGAKSYKIA